MPPLAFEGLQALQQADLQLDALRAEAEHIEDALADHGEIDEARRTLARLTATYEHAHGALRDAELALASVTDQVEQKSKLLYSGTVVSSRELEALQADIDQLMQQRATREEAALQAMVSAEEAEAARDEQQERLDALTTSFAAKQEEGGARLQELATEIPLREREREALLSQNDPVLLATYNSLRARVGGRVLVAVSQGRCTFCHITLPDTLLRQTQHSEKVVFCDSCGRMLFAPR